MSQPPYPQDPQQSGSDPNAYPPAAGPDAGPGQDASPAGQPNGPGPDGYGPNGPVPNGPGPYAYGPNATPPPPPKKSNTGKIVLIVVVAVLLVGGLTAFFALRGVVKNVADASTIRVVAPETLNNRAQTTDASLKQAAEQAATELKSKAPSATSVVSAFYGSPDKQDLALLVALSSINANPQSELDAAIDGINGSLKLTDVHTIDAGPLGGVAKCGDATSSGVKLGVCAWADRGSVGTFYSYFASAADTEKEFGKVREAVEQKS